FGRWWRLSAFLEPIRSESRLSALRPEGASEIAASQLDLDCDAVLAGDRPVCVSFDGRLTRFFTVDPEARRLIPLGSLAGAFRLYGRPRGGWIGGFHGNDRLVVHPETREAVRIPLGNARVRRVEANDRLISTVQWIRRGSTVRIYRFD